MLKKPDVLSQQYIMQYNFLFKALMRREQKFYFLAQLSISKQRVNNE